MGASKREKAPPFIGVARRDARREILRALPHEKAFAGLEVANGRSKTTSNRDVGDVQAAAREREPYCVRCESLL